MWAAWCCYGGTGHVYSSVNNYLMFIILLPSKNKHIKLMCTPYPDDYALGDET